MKKRISVTICIFALCAVAIAVLAIWPFNTREPQERYRTRIIVPASSGSLEAASALAEQMAYEDRYSLKVFLAEGEQSILVLNHNFDSDAIEEQVVAYRNLNDGEDPVYIAFIAYDERLRSYRRLWNAPTAAAMPGTVSMYTMDILGDRSSCIVITGMNRQGEHTMTVYRKNSGEDWTLPFRKIAEIQMDGSIAIQETERTGAYRQGIALGQPFVITAYGSDPASENLLDRIEISYEYSQARGIFGQTRISRVPGSQIEQRRLREILSGNAKVFEEFINDLWYHVNADGTIDRSQYLYFDPAKREIIFYGDETQQVFNWQSSNSTRYGIYISSQNISVTTLRRIMDIEMVTLDSIRMRVSEDVRIRIDVSMLWDGLYRRAGSLARSSESEKGIQPYTDATYDSSIGRFSFHSNGEYELSSGASTVKGRYVFFRADSRELLELRPDHGGSGAARQQSARGDGGESRLTYLVTSVGTADGAAGHGAAGNGASPATENLSLSRVRMAATGIQQLHENPIVLTRSRQ